MCYHLVCSAQYLTVTEQQSCSNQLQAKTNVLDAVVQYDSKLCQFLEDYDRAFIVHAYNVGSKQFQEIRRVSAIGPLCSKQLCCLSARANTQEPQHAGL